MKYIDVKEIAKNLLDSEFGELNNNPSDFCEAMGWDKGGVGTKRAIKKAGIMCADEVDILELTEIIVDLIMDNNTITVNDIVEDSKVSDFLVNCPAEHINR